MPPRPDPTGCVRRLELRVKTGRFVELLTVVLADFRRIRYITTQAACFLWRRTVMHALPVVGPGQAVEHRLLPTPKVPKALPPQYRPA